MVTRARACLYCLRIIATFGWLLGAHVALAQPLAPPSVAAQAYLLLDVTSAQVIVAENADERRDPASLTKLMTAMVVLDARLDMQQAITITDEDVDTLKHSSSRVPVGATFTRGTLLELALMSSDNRAAFALARTYPGGVDAFRQAVQNKGMEIGLRRTNIEEPTGLSPHNTSTATDLARLTDPTRWSTEDLRVLSNLIVTLMVGATEAIVNARPDTRATILETARTQLRMLLVGALGWQSR